MKIDLGCGPNKEKDHVGVDKTQFPGVDVVCDLGKEKWPFADDTIDEAKCSHMLEHLLPVERIHFMNELYRVLKKGAKCLVVTPYWASSRAYGDLTHQWPPVCEYFYFSLNKKWRCGDPSDPKAPANSPHLDADFVPGTFTCNFQVNPCGYTLREELQLRNHEYVQFALSNYKEAAQDMAQTIVKI